MKTILYMAQSLNGYIAKDNGDMAWIGSADKELFKQHTLEAGNVVMGRNTYEAMLEDGDFPLPGRLNVVMTRELKEPGSEEVVFTDKTPGEVLEFLREQNFEQAMVVGGGKIAKSFLEEKLIDEIYVTIEPVLIGRGVDFLERGEFVEEGDLEIDLKLLEAVKLSEDEIQLHYRVISSKALESDEGREVEEFVE